jgi:hypothetical protein
MTTHDPAPAPEVARGEKYSHEPSMSADSSGMTWCKHCELGYWLNSDSEYPAPLRLALDRAQGERDRMALALRLIMAEARNRGGDPQVLRWANLAEAALSPTEAP